jgi:hypothetical protein
VMSLVARLVMVMLEMVIVNETWMLMVLDGASELEMIVIVK